MGLQIYVRHPDETSLLIDEMSDLEEAIALCSDLVAVDGYERAEVWSEDGDRLYAMEREGASLRTITAPDTFVPPPERVPVADALPARPAPPEAPEPSEAPAERVAEALPLPVTPPAPPAPPAAAPSLLGGNGNGAEGRPADAPPPLTPPLGVPRILGEDPAHQERWLGL